MSKNTKTILRIPVCFICLFFIISSAGCASAGKAGVMPVMQNTTDFTPKEHKVIVAEAQTIDRFLNVDALVSYDDSKDLSFKIDNCDLKAVYVKSGDQVEEGQLLAELDASDLDYQIAERQIDLKRVQLMYDKVLSEAGTKSADGNTALESLKLDMESIELDITHIKELIGKTQLLAPFSGVITNVASFQIGEAVNAYEKFMTIWKSGSIKLVSDVLNPGDTLESVNLSGIVTGMKVILIYGSKDTRTEIPATITRIINTDPGIVNNPRRILSAPPPFLVYVKPDGLNADKLNLDRKVILRINTGTLENVIVLPKSAIRGPNNGHTVKVLKGEKIINRNITIGYEDKEKNTVAVTSGLRPGESVVIN